MSMEPCLDFIYCSAFSRPQVVIILFLSHSVVCRIARFIVGKIFCTYLKGGSDPSVIFQSQFYLKICMQVAGLHVIMVRVPDNEQKKLGSNPHSATNLSRRNGGKGLCSFS